MPTNSRFSSKVTVLNLQMDNLRKDEFLSNLDRGTVFTPNIDHLMQLQKDRAFYEAYQRADYRLCDSRIIQLMSAYFFSYHIQEQLAGSDMFPAFCAFHKHNSDRIRIFLLGGTEKGVKKAQKNINEQNETLLVVGSYSPPFGFEDDKEENEKILRLIQQSSANVLAVGVGAPKQELWIDAHREQLPEVDIFFAIGKTIDFIAGESKRAPAWLTHAGLEWLYRLLQEPLRLAKRYLLDDMPFFYLAFKQKMGTYKNPWG